MLSTNNIILLFYWHYVYHYGINHEQKYTVLFILKSHMCVLGI